jgi:hypothetical protein
MLETFPGDRLFRESVHAEVEKIEMRSSRVKNNVLRSHKRRDFSYRQLSRRNRDAQVVGVALFQVLQLGGGWLNNGINGSSSFHLKPTRNLSWL